MKRYACHRVYTQADHYLNQAFVAVDEKGMVVKYASFHEEIMATEWIGGVIFLSDTNIAPNGDFETWKSKHVKIGQTPFYAWHLSEFDFEKGEPTSNGIFHLL